MIIMESEKTSLGIFITAGLCFLVSIYVGLSRIPNNGLSLLFLLPFSFACTIIIFHKEYVYCRRSLGLIVLYISSFVRYIVTPLLIVISQSTVSTILANDKDYVYAIITEIFELIVTMIIIRHVWPKHLIIMEQIKEKSKFNPEYISFRLSWIGLAFVFMLIVLVLVRGHLSNILSHLSTWFYRVDTREELYGYDMMAFNIIKTVTFLFIVSLIKFLYDRITQKNILVTIALIIGVLNTMIFEFRERTDLAVLVIASFFVLSYAFPRNKKTLGLIFGIGGLALVSLIFMEGSLYYEMGSSLSTVNMADYSKAAELYTTGPSVIANAHMNYDYLRSQMSLATFLKDLLRSCDLFSTLPFLRFIHTPLSNTFSSVELYVASIGGLAYIIPNHILAALYVGDSLCWMLEPIFILFNIKLLGWFERRIYSINDLAQVYAVVSIVTMVATGVFCNNILLMLHSFSSLPLWLLFFSIINNYGNKVRIKKI